MASKTNLSQSQSQSSKYWDSYPPQLVIDLKDYLLNKDAILSKNISELNFHEVISLVFYAIEGIHSGEGISTSSTSNQSNADWTSLYKDFLALLESENKRRWPKLNCITNSYRKRLEVFFPSTFTQTNNILLLLLRLLYVETFKVDNMPAQLAPHPVLLHHINIPDKYKSTEVSLVRLFELLKSYLGYYVKIYHNEMMFEYVLGKKVSDHI